MKVIIYTNQITDRVKHAFSLIVKDVLGCEEVIITDRLDDFNSSTLPKINYSELELLDAVQVKPHGLLTETGIRDVDIAIGTWDDEVTLFPKSDCVIPFDIFAASFFLTSRYEEHKVQTKDHYNRFLAEESVAYKNGFLGRPVVNIWAKKFKKILQEKFPTTSFPNSTYRFIATVDVDNAYAYKEKGMVRTTGALVRSLLSLNVKDFVNRTKCLLGLMHDPFDSFDKQMTLHKQYGFDAIYFFLVGDYGLNDKNVPISSRKFQSLIKHVADYSAVGIHPSFASNEEPRRVKMEIDRLAKVVHRPITKSRQHFLTLSLPNTYTTLIEDGVTDDYTMGYASMLGFRASICSTYTFYNLEAEQSTSLRIHPFALMEATLRHYMNVPAHQALDFMLPIINEVKAVDGTLMTLWHNDSLSELAPWEGWSGLYEEVLKAAR